MMNTTRNGKKRLKKVYEKQGKDPDVEIKIDELVTSPYSNIFYLWVVAIPLLLGMEIYSASGKIEEVNVTFNMLWVAVAIALFFATAIIGNIFDSAARKELCEYNILDEETLDSMPRLGKTSDYIK